MTYMNKRIDYIDVAKAIAMMLVIIAHSMSSNVAGMLFLGTVYSFHMPLFFICSGITFKKSSTFIEWKMNSVKSVKQLYCPAILLSLLKMLYVGYYENKTYNLSEVINVIKSIIWASGVDITVGGVAYTSIGMMWFLVVFCISRILFDMILTNTTNEILQFFITSMFGVIGIMSGSVYPMPMSLDVSLAALPLFFIGYLMKKGFVNTILAQPISIKCSNIAKFGILWIIVIFFTRYDWMDWIYLNMAARRYPFFPLCYVGAVLGTITMFYVCSVLTKVKCVNSIMSFFGKNTIIILGVHYLDNVFQVLWNIENYQFLTGGLRAILDFVIAFIVISVAKTQFVKNIHLFFLEKFSI